MAKTEGNKRSPDQPGPLVTYSSFVQSHPEFGHIVSALEKFSVERQEEGLSRLDAKDERTLILYATWIESPDSIETVSESLGIEASKVQQLIDKPINELPEEAGQFFNLVEKMIQKKDDQSAEISDEYESIRQLVRPTIEILSKVEEILIDLHALNLKFPLTDLPYFLTVIKRLEKEGTSKTKIIIEVLRRYRQIYGAEKEVSFTEIGHLVGVSRELVRRTYTNFKGNAPMPRKGKYERNVQSESEK